MEPSEMSRLTRTVFRRMRLPMTEPSDFQSALARHADTLGVLLANLLDTRPLDGEIARPDHLMAAMRHGALNGGKRLRPFLLVETARLFDKTGEAVMRVAAALERHGEAAGITWWYEPLPDESHSTIYHRAALSALRHLFPAPDADN